MLKNALFRIKLVLALSITMVIVHIVNIALDGYFVQFGIIPRSEEHWYHVFSSPFIHGDWGHLLSNLVGFVIFSALCLARSLKLYVFGSLFIISLTGALVWCFARGAVHIGASGWIFGLWSFSIAIAWFDRKLINILTSIVVVFMYGGMVYGVLPTDPRISFEAHLFGALSGLVCAFIYSLFTRSERRAKKAEKLTEGH